MKKTLVLLASVAVMSSSVMACERPQIQAYAHPTLFGSEAQVDVCAKTSSIIGGKIEKCPCAKTVISKDNVLVKSFAKKELDKFAQNGNFNKTAPVLRGELAQTLADGLRLSEIKKTDEYSDVPSTYWAKQAIDEALAADIMIGYPDKTFKPEQKVTKAEVFCTLAKIFDVDHNKTATPKFNNKTIKHIPNWAVGATNEVLATGILNAVPDENALINNEYLTKEQAAYLVGALSEYLKNNPSAATARVNAGSCGDMLIKIDERLSARTSNAGDTFTATLLKDATVEGKTFPAGAKVKGIVSEVVRPGVGNTGYIKVQFKEVKDGDCVTALPESVCEASTECAKDANFVARLVGAPLSASARVLGVAGRTVSQQALLTSNGVEKYGDELSNTLVNTFSLQPVAGAKKFGASFVTIGKYVWNTVENVAGGVFGVGYEFVDEVRYLVAPKYSNNSSLNPKETLKVTFEK